MDKVTYYRPAPRHSCLPMTTGLPDLTQARCPCGRDWVWTNSKGWIPWREYAESFDRKVLPRACWQRGGCL